MDTNLRGTEFVGHFYLSGTSGRLKQSILCQIKQLLESRLSRRGFLFALCHELCMRHEHCACVELYLRNELTNYIRKEFLLTMCHDLCI